jgi:hypothetical protein
VTIRLEWDGERRIGPVYLGMSLDECREAIPGVYDDSPVVSDPELVADLEPSAGWWSDEYGVMVSFLEGVATFIACNDHFWYQSLDLVGQPLETALQALGGGIRVANDWDTLQIHETERGPEAWSRDGVVTCISIDCERDD